VGVPWRGLRGRASAGKSGDGHASLASGGLAGRVASRLVSLWPIHGVWQARGEVAGACDFHSCCLTPMAPADEACASVEGS
jgi:hypothetical protein